MGGINPEKGPKPTKGLHHSLTTLTQEVARNLFRSAAEFYAAHAELETAVLGEGEGKNVKEKELRNAIKGFETSVAELTSAKEAIDKHRDDIKKDGTWHQPYFESLYRHLVNMIKHAKKVHEAINRNSVVKSANSRKLQESLWHKNENAAVRENSLRFIEELGKTMSMHAEFVDITNIKSPKFLQ